MPKKKPSETAPTNLQREKKPNEILRAKRRELDRTQEDVAKELGLSTMGLSYLERGSRDLKVEMLDKWATVLGMKLTITLEDL